MAFNAGAVVGTVELDTKDFESKSKTAQQTITDFGKSLTKVGGILTATVTAPLVAFGVASVKAFTESEQAGAKLEAIIKSTGGAAGLTAREMQSMAASLQSVTTFQDDAIVNAEALLATFTKIGEDTFPRATEAILDLSAAFGQDLQSSAVQVGKALQDPIAGVTALRRVGVQLSKSQEDLIKQFVSLGEVEKAQAVILKELETQVGGVARAMAKTASGELKQLENKFNDLQEEVGRLILEALRPLVKFANEVIDGFMALDEDTKKMILTIAGLAAAIGPVLLIGGQLVGLIGAIASPAGIAITAIALLTAGIVALAWAQEDARKKSEENLNNLRSQDNVLESLLDKYDRLTAQSKLNTDEQAELKQVLKDLQAILPENALMIDKYGNAMSINKVKAREFRLEQLKTEMALNNASRADKQRTYDALGLQFVALQEAQMTARKTGNAIYEMQLSEQIKAVSGRLKEAGDSLQPFTERTKEINAEIKGIVTEIDNEEKALKRSQKAVEDNIKAAERYKAVWASYMSDSKKNYAETTDENFKVAMKSLQSQKDAVIAFENEKKKVAEATNAEMQAAFKETVDKANEDITNFRNALMLGVDSIKGAFDQYISNETTTLDNKYKKDKERIEATVGNEEEKQAQLKALDEDYQKNKAEIQKKAFAANQIASIIQSGINTALAVTQALTAAPPPFNFILAGIVAAAGAAQTALIAAAPMPEFALGGTAQPDRPFIAGENGPEVINVGSTSRIFNAEDTERMVGSQSVKIYFTGPINSEVDSDKMASKLAFKLRRTRRKI